MNTYIHTPNIHTPYIYMAVGGARRAPEREVGSGPFRSIGWLPQGLKHIDFLLLEQ